MHEIDKIEYSRGCSHIGTCWNRNCWQSPSRICLISFHSSTLLLHNFISSFKVFCTGMHEIDKIEYSRGHSDIGTCWIQNCCQNCWQSPSRICLTSFHSSTLLLHNFISSFKVFCTGMHEIDKIEYSRGCSVSSCEYSILIFYLVLFFSSGRPMVIFSLACLVLKNIISFRRSV